jgi:hypothetical protein
MKTRHVFLAAAGALLVACNDATRPVATPEITPNLNLAATAAALGWAGGDLGTADVTADQAQHFRDFPCGIPTTEFFPVIVTTESHTTISESGNTTLYCKGQLPANIPAPEGGAVIFRDFGCGTQGGGTTDSHAVITPSGNIILLCKVHPNQS